jgi:hypothetical protein
LLKDFDISAIIDLDGARDAIGKLLNLIEELQQENQALKRLNQMLRDELRRLSGEQGKPDIKPSRKDTGSKNFSSEKERKKRKKRNKKSKKDRIKTHNKRICKVDPESLPEDAGFKGYQRVVVQDVIFKASNTPAIIQHHSNSHFSALCLNKVLVLDVLR